MSQEQKTVVRDGTLGLEACRFQGMSRPFPSHFHTCYVLGLMERGSRRLVCRGQSYDLQPGHVVLFAPGESHGCVQTGGEMDYRSVSLPQELLLAWTQALPRFSAPALRDPEAAELLWILHEAVTAGGDGEAPLRRLLDRLLSRHEWTDAPPAPRGEAERLCRYLQHHLAERVSLEDLCRLAGLSKSTLLRTFTRATGATPYRYLENLRVAEARRLLAQGVSPAEAALRTGFSDQSHLTRCFGRYMGVPPGVYQAAGGGQAGRLSGEFRRKEESYGSKMCHGAG